MSKASITFYGGAGTVTGSNFLLDGGDVKILIDCGAIEREHVCDDANSAPFAYDPRAIHALIVTHAHADHIGRIPKLVHDGFKGTIHSTAATRDLAALMFDDALSVMETEQKKKGCTMMYQKEDVMSSLSLWKMHEYHESFTIGSATVELLDAGHILGSAMVKLSRGGEGVFGSLSGVATPALPLAPSRSETPENSFASPRLRAILFTGDLGNSPEPLLNDTESPAGAHYLVMESVYGDRLHENREGRTEVLRTAIEETRERKGVLLIPSFSIERTQILLYELDTMMEEGTIQPIPVYLDAPLAIKVTGVFRRHKDLLKKEVHDRFAEGNDPFTFKGLTLTKDIADSREIHEAPNPKVIIAGAGMSSGGRIRAHEKQYLGDDNATILFVGYQAPCSLGRRIQDGEKKVQIDNEWIKVRTQVQTLSGYSGHKDRDALLSFVEDAAQTRENVSLERVFVVMGEPKSELFLAQRIRDFLGVDAVVPTRGEVCVINW